MTLLRIYILSTFRFFSTSLKISPQNPLSHNLEKKRMMERLIGRPLGLSPLFVSSSMRTRSLSVPSEPKLPKIWRQEPIRTSSEVLSLPFIHFFLFYSFSFFSYLLLPLSVIFLFLSLALFLSFFLSLCAELKKKLAACILVERNKGDSSRTVVLRRRENVDRFQSYAEYPGALYFQEVNSYYNFSIKYTRFLFFFFLFFSFLFFSFLSFLPSFPFIPFIISFSQTSHWNQRKISKFS